MPNRESTSSWPEWRYPKWRGLGGNLTPEGWLAGRREDDGAEGLWRVHDGLYELTPWIHAHPGGSEWLEITKGTDVTEAFEAHHLGPLAPTILTNFYVRRAKTPRNSPFTFKPDGFYRTLKSRIYEKLKDVKPGPSTRSKRIVDILATGTIVLSILAAVYHDFLVGSVAGVLLTLTVVASHNFFHMRDNWRMYLFNMSLMTVRHWRISHALSHHLFPNTHHDLEISMFEPLLQYFPKTEKTKFFGIASAIYSPFLYPFLYFLEAYKRLTRSPPHAQDLVGLLLPTLMVVVGRVPPLEALIMWLFILMVGSFLFGVIALNAAHHHPDIFHNGDKPREDRDWGLNSLDATRERVEVYNSPILGLVTFGDHCIHHLFPTIDHAYLHLLNPMMEQSCKEFGLDFQIRVNSIAQLMAGQFRQLVRNTPNPKKPL